jgi:hypothetical protein
MTSFRERLPRHCLSVGIGMVIGGIMMLSLPAHASPVQVATTDGTFPMTCTLVDSHLSCSGDLPTESPTTPPPTTAPPTTVPPTTAPPTTPPPTTTGPQVNCLALPSRCGFPDSTNTGPAAGTFTVMTSLTANVANKVYDHIQVNGCTTVTAPGVTIRNSRLLGNGCFYSVNNQSTGLKLDHDEISCSDSANTGVTLANYAISFSNIHGCENGLNVADVGNVSLTDSWIHNMFRGSTSHTDGVQIGQGAANIIFRHNTIAMSTDDNSAIIMWDEENPQNSNLQVTNNLLTGGGFTVYCPRMNASNVTVIGNRFGTFAFGFSNGCTAGHATWLNNVRDSNGSSIPAV